MATVKVSALTAKTTPAGTEELLINDGGTSKKITLANAVKATDLPTAPSGIASDTNKEYNLKLTDSGGTETLTWVEETDDDTTYTSSDFTHDDLTGFVSNEHIDWTTDQGSTNIHTGNYTDTNTTYTSSDFTHDDLTGFVANEHIDWTVAGNTIHADNYTDTDTTYVNSDWNHDSLTGFVANEHIDWTTDQGATNIHSGNYTDTNTTYTSSDFTHDSLSGVTANEHIDWTGASAGTIHSSNYTDTNTMGSGFTVSATTDTTPTTITQGDDLMFTAGSGITCETTADGTVTITNTVSGAGTATSSATGVIKIEDDTDQSVAANTVSATAGRTYGIQLNSSNQAVVNVPWTDTDTNTTYSVGDNGLTQKNFTSTLKSKLDGIAASANNYSHPSYNGDDFSIDTGHLSGATVIDDIDINVTTDSSGHVTDANGTVATRNLTLSDLGYSGATNANYITNNNQLSNGAGYITSYTNTTYSAGGSYGMTLSGTEFRLEDDRRRNSSSADIYSGNTHDYTFYDASHGIRWYTANAEEMRLEDDGDLHVDGDVLAYSTTVSDERLKENIQPIEDALNKVNQLNGCTFTYTTDGKESAGLIAQDVEKVLPSAISESTLPLKQDDGKEYKVLQYDQTIGLLVEAIKELTAKVEELESK